MEKGSMWRAAKSALFCLGLVAVLSVTSFVMKPSIGTLNGWAAGEHIEGEVDVLALGSSRTYCTILPMEMWRQDGVTGLDITGAIQTMPVTAAYLEQALKTHQPQVVMVELYMVGKRSTFDVNTAHKNLDYMPASLPKVGRVLESVDATGWFEVFFPLQQYHSRWTELRRSDFLADKHSRYAFGRGAMYLPDAKPVPDSPKVDGTSEEAYQLDLPSIRAMARACQKRDVQLVLFAAPSPYRLYVGDQPLLGRLKADLQAEFPSVGYLDMNAVAGTIGVDPATDYKDELHVNHRGGVKLSRWLAGHLVREYGLIDRRGEDFAARWNEDLRRYDKVFVADW